MVLLTFDGVSIKCKKVYIYLMKAKITHSLEN